MEELNELEHRRRQLQQLQQQPQPPAYSDADAAAAAQLNRREQLRLEREARKQKLSEKKESVQDQLEAERRAYKERKMQLGDIMSNDQNNPVSDAQDKVIQHAADLQRQNQETLDRTLRRAYETNETADDTQLKLKSQSEQLRAMDKALDGTNESLNRSERTIRGLTGIAGRFKNWVTKPTKHESHRFEDPRGLHPTNEVRNAVTDKQQRSRENGTFYGSEYHGRDKVALAQQKLSSNGLNARLPEAQRYAQQRQYEQQQRQGQGLDDDSNAVDDAVEAGLDGSMPVEKKKKWFGRSKEPVIQPVEPLRERIAATGKEIEALEQIKANTAVEDEQLDELSNVLKQLHVKAADMNKELQIQNAMVDHIGEQTSHTTTRIKQSNAKIKGILS